MPSGSPPTLEGYGGVRRSARVPNEMEDFPPLTRQESRGTRQAAGAGWPLLLFSSTLFEVL